ncbi:hypothetical protein HY087_00910 [Candidatus Gottesmanbacteria bacterium]|nr:hypothetical protein [Candidatus Gottesmanbacteria bacterium]MBI3559673.1 hypothetical protein [Candidatus Gottesmanbacteria bacterium]
MISPQSQQLYRTLLEAQEPLSAMQLGQKLRVVPQSVYRLVNSLADLGLVTKSSAYPSRFMAKPVDEAASLFLLAQNDWFARKFSRFAKQNVRKGEKSIPPFQHIQLSFIQSRDELMRWSAEEINKASRSVDLLRSGREMPAEVMLAIVQAHKRGVVTRMLIQDYSSENAELVNNWKQNGIVVRKTSLRHIRLMLYDTTVVYFMSYTHADSTKDLGVKITYPPLAAMLTQQFDEWWRKGEKL